MATITALNGRLPADELDVADIGPNRAQQLRADAAASWERMLGAGMPAGHLRSGYRTRAQQAAEVARVGRGAAPVGTSQHGEGLAADVDEPARSWIAKWGRPYGWVSGRVPGEPWHMEYEPTLDQQRPTTAPAAPVSTPPRRLVMLVLIQAQRGHWLVGPGYAHQLNGAEWNTPGPIGKMRDAGLIGQYVFPDGTGGATEFDDAIKAFTQGSRTA